MDRVLRARCDVAWQPEEDGWLAFDPLTRASFRCGHAQRWLFDQLDGQHSLTDIYRNWSDGAARSPVSWQELQALAQDMISRGLVREVSSTSRALDRQSAKRPWVTWLSQSVSWRVRGLNPEKWLARAASHCDIFFARLAVYVWGICASLVALLIVADFQRLAEQATLWQWLIKPTSGTTLFAIFIVTRAIHELGHALVLTRLGGRCPDIGLIFVLGAPCVYCDVSESWRLRNWRERAAVAAGGMYAEMLVATLAGTVWLCTTPSPLNTLALQTMIVCSVSTWLINANPLMRFDGYFILSDYLRQPNLRAQADQCCLRWLERLLLGKNPVSPTRMPHSREIGYALFSLAGLIYRLALSWMMASVIVALYSAWHFEWIGRLFAWFLLVCWWGLPAMKLSRHLWTSAQSIWTRIRLGLLTAWAMLMFYTIPLPYHVHSEGWLQPETVQGLYSPASARLQQIHKSVGSRVQVGETIAELDSRHPQLKHVELKRHADRAQAQLVALRKQRFFSDNSAVDLAALESTAKNFALQAEHAAELAEQYQLRATMSGTLVSLPSPPLTDVDQHRLVTQPSCWLDQQQQGRLVPAGTMLAAISSNQQIAVVPLDDHQLSDVVVGTRVRLMLPAHNDQVIDSEVSKIVQLSQLDTLSHLLNQTQEPQTESTRIDQAKPFRSYAALVPIPENHWHTGASVQVVFKSHRRTLANRTFAWLRQNLRW